MKLRNKKTRKIVYALVSAYGISGDVAVSVMDSNAESGYTDLGRYKTLAELNEDWEDYKPAEPLIKDEKIRKAVRAWAEANRVTEAMYSSCHDAECEFNARDDENKMIVFIGNFQEMNERLDITGRTIYTIAELCGEEEK